MAAFAPTEQTPTYPVRLSMQYPEHVSRVSTFFRLILVIPALIFVTLLSGGGYVQSWGSNGTARGLSAGAGGSIVVAIWATILLRGRIPEWLFNFRVAVNRFTYRAYAYAALLTDRYPAFEGEWDLQYHVDYPGRLSRWRLFFWKVLTALPHFFVLAALLVAATFVVFIGWFAILFTGSFPRGLHRFVVGVMRWSARVAAYVESLTDAFPPFSLDEDAGPGAGSTAAICAVIGGVLLAALIAGGIAAGVAIYKVTNHTETVRVSYAAALAGSLPTASSYARLDNVVFDLNKGTDPATVDVVRARPGSHLVEFTIGFQNLRALQSQTNDVKLKTIRLQTRDEGTVEPVLLTADGFAVPADVRRGTRVALRAIFEVKDGDSVEGLRAYPLPTSNRRVLWKFQ